MGEMYTEHFTPITEKNEEIVDKLKNETFHKNVAAQLKQIFTDIRRGISKRYQT